MQQKIFLIIGVLAVLTIVIALKDSKPKQETAAPPVAAEQQLSDKERLKLERPLRPVDPSDYGMITTNPKNGPLSEEDISVIIRDKWKEVKEQFPEETTKVLEKIKETPEKTQEKMTVIERELAKCREILQKDPFNEEITRKQHNLLALKALGREMAPDFQ